MTECYEGCEYMQVAVEAGDDLLEKYNALIKERDWLLQYIDFLGDCNDARSEAMLGEIKQLRDLPEGLWWPLVSQHGVKLAIDRWQDMYSAIAAKHREFLDDGAEHAATAALGNVVPFPSRTK